MDLGAHLVSHYFTGCGSCVCSQNHSILPTHTEREVCYSNCYTIIHFALH